MVRANKTFTQYVHEIPPDEPINPIAVPSNGVAEVQNGFLQSPSYVRGRRGWRLNDDGSAEFRNVNIGSSVLSIDDTGSILDSVEHLNSIGGGILNLKAGTYVVDSAITLRSSVSIVGENLSNTIIDFNGSANMSCTGTNVYTTGTITSITSGVNVTGSGTSWLANVTAGQHIFIGTRWYKIATVTSDTALILAEGYSDNVTMPGATYRIATITSGLSLRNLTLTGSSGTAISIQDARRGEFDNILCHTNNKAISLTNVSEFSADQVIATSNTSNGIEMTNCGLFDWESINLVSNGGHGGVLNTCKDLLLFPVLASGNTTDGLNLTSCTNLIMLVDCSGNQSNGIELVSGNDDISLLNPRIVGNTSDGIKLTATSDNCHINAGKISNNGGYGINIAASTCDNTNVTGNVFSSNTSGGVSDSGTQTIIRGNNGVNDNALNGSFVNSYQATASENIALGDAVSIGAGIGYVLTSNSTSSVGETVTNTTWVSQGFTTSSRAKTIKSCTIRVSTGGSSNTMTASLRADSSNLPTGADIGSITGTVAMTPSSTNTYTITFSSPITVSASTKYHLVFRTNGTGDQIERANSSGQDTGNSTNSGSTWGAINGKLYFSVTEVNTVSGQICSSSGTTSTDRQTFIGYAPTAITSGNVGSVYTSGVFTGKTGLTAGSQYYLSDTFGAISTTPGTVSKKAGIGLSSTDILILNN